MNFSTAATIKKKSYAKHDKIKPTLCCTFAHHKIKHHCSERNCTCPVKVE